MSRTHNPEVASSNSAFDLNQWLVVLGANVEADSKSRSSLLPEDLLISGKFGPVGWHEALPYRSSSEQLIAKAESAEERRE